MKKKLVLFVLVGVLFAATIAPTDAQGGWLVVAWAGDAGDLPTGWQLCDGSNGTPDLVDRFLVGAGDTYALAATGGTITNSLSHQHQVASHSHTISTVDLSHTHSVPSHNHSINSSGALAHTHDLPYHQHSIGTADLSHTHNLAYEGIATGAVRQNWVGWGAPEGVNRMIGFSGGGSSSFYLAFNYTTGMSANSTHNHGGGTGYVYNVGTVTDGNVNHNHGGTTGNWNGTSGAMSANSTHNHGGTTGSVSPMTDYQLSATVENRPPYYAVYYACAPADVWATSPISATAMITDPLTTDYYTTTTGIVYSRARTVDTGTEITNYLLIGVLALYALQFLFNIITKVERKWN